MSCKIMRTGGYDVGSCGQKRCSLVSVSRTATRETSSRFGSYTSGFGCTSVFGKVLKNIISSLYFSFCYPIFFYFFVPISHVAQGVLHAGSPAFPFLSNVRKSINNPAVHPPTIAVTVKYVLSLRAAVIARSTPPGIEDNLSNTISVDMQKKTQLLNGFMATLQIA